MPAHHKGNKQRVSQYKVDASTVSATGPWTPVQEGKVFVGNQDPKGVKVTKFDTPVSAKWLRITPVHWIKAMAMRVALNLVPKTARRTGCCEARCGDACGLGQAVFDNPGTCPHGCCPT